MSTDNDQAAEAAPRPKCACSGAPTYGRNDRLCSRCAGVLTCCACGGPSRRGRVHAGFCSDWWWR